VTTYHGTTMVLTKQKLNAKIQKEYLGELNGSGADQDFYTANFPITDSSGSSTDDETEVDVFTDDGSPGTYTEYQDDGSDFTIDGSEGKVTIKAAENQAGNAGEKIYISYYTKRDIGYAQDVSVRINGNVVAVHELGERLPQELKGGRIEISGEIGQFYIDRDMFGGFLSLSGINERLSDFTLYLDPNGSTSGQPRITLSGVKFSGGTLQASIDTITLNRVEYMATAVSIGTVP